MTVASSSRRSESRKRLTAQWRKGLNERGFYPMTFRRFSSKHSAQKFRAMPEADLRNRIKEMLVTNLMLQTSADQIADDLPLFGAGGLGLDSIDALELVVSMEKTFGVAVPNSEVAGKALRTVNSIHDYILEKTERPAA